jgi:hypothetical protein
MKGLRCVVRIIDSFGVPPLLLDLCSDSTNPVPYAPPYPHLLVLKSEVSITRLPCILKFRNMNNYTLIRQHPSQDQQYGAGLCIYSNHKSSPLRNSALLYCLPCRNKLEPHHRVRVRYLGLWLRDTQGQSTGSAPAMTWTTTPGTRYRYKVEHPCLCPHNTARRMS